MYEVPDDMKLFFELCLKSMKSFFFDENMVQPFEDVPFFVSKYRIEYKKRNLFGYSEQNSITELSNVVQYGSLCNLDIKRFYSLYDRNYYYMLCLNEKSIKLSTKEYDIDDRGELFNLNLKYSNKFIQTLMYSNYLRTEHNLSNAYFFIQEIQDVIQRHPELLQEWYINDGYN